MRSLLKEFILILGLTLCGASYSLLSGLAPAPWAPPTILPGEIRWQDAAVLNVIWVDARSHDDYQQDHIPEALWFDPEDWDAGLLNLMDAWLEDPRPIIVYCSSASCQSSREVATYLRESIPGTEVYSLQGGFEAWKK